MQPYKLLFDEQELLRIAEKIQDQKAPYSIPAANLAFNALVALEANELPDFGNKKIDEITIRQ